MRKYFRLLLTGGFVFLLSTGNAQLKNEIVGNYKYEGKHFYNEYLELKKDGQFSYVLQLEFGRISINGNWQLRNSNKLVLDSRPQSDRIIVQEHFNKGIRGKKIVVYGKDGFPIQYWLYTISSNHDTTEYKNQFEASIVKKNVKAFYLINMYPSITPLYTIKGLASNLLIVYLDKGRIFENEAWTVEEGKITPLDGEGKVCSYSLEKTN